jgi:hypothetical protein
MLLFRPSIYLFHQHEDCADPECGRCNMRARNAQIVLSASTEPTQVIVPPYVYARVNPHHSHLGPVHTGEVFLHALYAVEWFRVVFAEKEDRAHMRAVFPDRFELPAFIEQRARAAELFAPHDRMFEAAFKRHGMSNLELLNCLERAVLAGLAVMICVNESRPTNFIDSYVARHLSVRLVVWEHDRCVSDEGVRGKAKEWEEMRLQKQ